MPPLRTYVFDCKFIIGLTVTIEAYREMDAWMKLAGVVKDVKDFELKKGEQS